MADPRAHTYPVMALSDRMKETHGDAGIVCSCGAQMLWLAFDGVYIRVSCPKCGKTPLHLLERSV